MVLGHLAHETARARPATLDRGQHQQVSRAGHRHVGEAALLLQREVLRRALAQQLDGQDRLLALQVRHHPLDQLGHEDGVELQPLRLVDRHQPDAIELQTGPGLAFRLAADLLVDVEVAQEGGKRPLGLIALPACREAEEPGHREDVALRLARPDRQQIVEAARSLEVLVEDGERAVAVDAGRERVDHLEKPGQPGAQSGVECLAPAPEALLARPALPAAAAPAGHRRRRRLRRSGR